ncbi:hypothetical protein [Amycolatopsis sp. lyj-23]|uniref:hypothetical protein n=1 Tax=Amycolatopsis sp. lyj-23 TaxID=2789283 RepID=UPI00397E1FB0
MRSFVVPDAQFNDQELGDDVLAHVEIGHLGSGAWRLSPHDPTTEAKLAARFPAWCPQAHGEDELPEEYLDYRP